MILEKPRSIVIACDLGLDAFGKVLRETHAIDGVGAYQIPAVLSERHGLPILTNLARETGKKLIYEGNLGSGRPEDAERYADLLEYSGIDAVTLFPISGMEVGKAWMKAFRERGIGIIVRGLPTYPGYTVPEGGYVESNAWRSIYDEAVKEGITDLQIPRNRPDDITSIKENIEALEEPEVRGVCAGKKIIIDWYPTGFGKQGGKIENIRDIGERVHPVVGGLITETRDHRGAANRFIELLEAAYK